MATAVFKLPFGGGGLGATYAVHLRLIVKPVVDFLFVLINFFSLGITVQALRANIEWKSAFLKGVGQFGQTFQVEWDVHHQHFCTDR